MTAPRISYARSADGVSLAFTVAGDGPAVVFVPWVPFSNMRMEWQIPLLNRVFEQLARRLVLVHYDGRGTGHSQRDVTDLSLEAMVSDLEAVIGQAGLTEVSLLGQYNSCPHAIAYAARHPERVKRMVLLHTSPERRFTSNCSNRMSPTVTRISLRNHTDNIESFHYPRHTPRMKHPKRIYPVSFLMKAEMRTRIAAIPLIASLIAATPLAAQQPRFRLVDIGTLGGPHSYGEINGADVLLNNSGIVGSWADTAMPDPNAPDCPNCFLGHAFRWKDGVISDLGALPGVNFSAVGSINSRGWATGQSQTSTLDPILGSPEFRGVLWKEGQIFDLGTLGSGTESLGIYVNDAGQVIGLSTINTEPDPVGFGGFPTHTFIWQNGHKLDIGTLGGDDTFTDSSCSHPPEGMVVGQSTTSTTANSDTGLPTFDPFLWDHGKMTDLGTLGGTFGFAHCTNSRHQVIGQSSLADTPIACTDGHLTSCHAFLWEDGKMRDLGTLGGPNSEPQWINESGLIVGSADFPRPQPAVNHHDAVIWKNGKIKDLGTVDGDPCSRAYAVNARGQVVGGSSDCTTGFLHAFLWEEGRPMLDLNKLIPPGSGWVLTNAFNINDRGEILAKAAPEGFTPNDDADLGHLALLIPCREDDWDCENSIERPETMFPQDMAPHTTQLSGKGNAAAWRARFAGRYHLGEH